MSMKVFFWQGRRGKSEQKELARIKSSTKQDQTTIDSSKIGLNKSICGLDIGAKRYKLGTLNTLTTAFVEIWTFFYQIFFKVANLGKKRLHFSLISFKNKNKKLALFDFKSWSFCKVLILTSLMIDWTLKICILPSRIPGTNAFSSIINFTMRWSFLLIFAVNKTIYVAIKTDTLQIENYILPLMKYAFKRKKNEEETHNYDIFF